jgi:hypothetical protein
VVNACLIATIVVVLCLVGCVWIVVRDARTTGASMLSPRGWVRRWPLYALSAAAVLALILAAQYGC